VLPDAKKSENDVVVFLDQENACDCEQEAQQRAAVAALHRIAGNRSLERTLPPQYVKMWKALGEKAKVREERDRRYEERQRREKEMKARAKKKELRGQGPTQVIMTDVHRAVIEGILQDAMMGGCSDDDIVEECPSDARGRSNGGTGRVGELAAELETLGFSSQDAAVAASKRNGLSSALDWLCLNIPEDRLPSEFAASGAAGKPVTVIQWNGERAVGQPEEAEVTDPAVVELQRYGYGRDESMKALESHKGDVSSSAVSLFLSMCLSAGHAGCFSAEADYGRESPVPKGDAVDEERMALEAIYGDAVTFSGNRVDVCLVASGGDGVGDGGAGDDAPTKTTMQFILPSSYPDMCPVVTVQSSAASGARMKHLMMAIVLPGLVATRGAPAVYEIATLVGDSIEDLPEHVDESAGEDDATEREPPQEIAAGDPAARIATASRPRASRPHHGSMSRAQARQESERLSAQYDKLKNGTSNNHIMKQRRSLPAASMRDEVVQAIGGSAVTIIMGSTGCGKSTQVPQFILEDAIEQSRGGECNIICTQPRRISAIGLASRVAQERGESVGSTVGYSVRLDSKQSRQTRLLFCTTGVMLRRLLGDPDLKSITHVVLDEVHERSIESDLLLFLLRDLLRTGKNPNVKIVLMSATADAQLFAGYFSTSRTSLPPVISIPGFTHPVRDCFLEDVLELTGYQVGKTSKWAKKSVKGEDALVDRYRAAGYSDTVARSMAVVDESAINVDLVEALVCSVLKQAAVDGSPRKPNNAILIFVPGAYLITKLVKALSSSASIASGGFKVMALPLHGGLPPSQQSRVFDRPPLGTTKIVVATNVAETSITIDDVTCVIDSGKANEVRFDPVKGISRLQEVFVSQASCKQRRGRAGRVQPGVCYRLFSKKTWNNMDENTLPEICRSALHSLVMDTKAIVGGDVFEVLDNMITPPPKEGLRRAVQSLELIGALETSTQVLTPLGKHLTQMPCDPKLGKMLIYGALLRCVDPVLTIVAAQAFGKSVFWSTIETRSEADAMRTKLVTEMTGGSSPKSDHIATIAAFNGWRRVVHKTGRKDASRYCTEYFISEQAMDAIRQGRRQFAQILSDLGFISSSYVASVDRPSLELEHGEPDEYAGHARVVKAAIASGLYPQLLRVENPAAQFQKVHGGAFETEAVSGGKVKLFDRERGRVFIHPSSVNFPVGKFESGWLVYSDIMETSKVFVRECSMVPVYSVLLFAGSVAVQHEKATIVVDDWATFKAPARIGVLVREMRQALAKILDKKIQDATGYDMSSGEKRLIDALHQLLASDGF
jgi:ATP-dependent RNA helicase DHX57